MFNVVPMGLGKTIREVRLGKGWTLEKLEEESGVAAGTIHALEARDSLRSQYFPQLARALGYTVDQLVHRDLKADNLLVAEPAAAYVGLGGPILAWEHEEELPEGEFVLIPRLDVRLSAGHGRELVEVGSNTKSPVAFRADWMRKQRLRPKAILVMEASGDSMEDRVHDGDLLAVDTSKVEVKDGGVYALWYDGGERVKRLFRMPGGGLRIHSDNADKYPDIVLPPGELEHVRIIGRVVHQSGTGGL